jgi:hypothetical protein
VPYTLGKEKGEYKTVAIIVARSSELNKMYQRAGGSLHESIRIQEKRCHLRKF